MSRPDRPPAGDEVRVSVPVAVSPAVAFQVFTEEIDHWWRRGPKYRLAGQGRGIIQLEPGRGGRLLESFETESDRRVVETGRITTWEPPSRLVLEWRSVNFAPLEKTEVQVRFEPSPSGTLVTLTHRGWSRIRADHPVRHGLEGEAFIRMMGLWWGDLLSAMREHAARESGAGGDS